MTAEEIRYALASAISPPGSFTDCNLREIYSSLMEMAAQLAEANSLLERFYGVAVRIASAVEGIERK